MTNRTSLTPGSSNRGVDQELQLFGNTNWGVRHFEDIPVLTATVDGILHYEGVGFCRLTGHRNAPDAIASHVAPHQKTKLDITAAQTTLAGSDGGLTWGNIGPNPYRWFIAREGANRLVLESRLPGAQRIKHWLADDVMTSIEDTGGYVVPGSSVVIDLDDPLGELERTHTALGKAIALVRTERAGRINAEARVKELEPAEAMMKTYGKAKGLTTKRAFARDVQQWAIDENLEISQQQIFDYLNHIGLFIRSDTSEHDQAMSQAIKDRKAKNVTVKIEHNDGTIEKRKYGKLTAKGENYAWKRIQAALTDYGTLDLDVIKGAVSIR